MALTILAFSIVTAVAALLAGLAAHATLLDRTEEIVGVANAGNDELTAELLRTKHDLQTALGQDVSEEEIERIAYIAVQAAQSAAAAETEAASAVRSVADHLLFSIAATIAAIAIAVTGLAPIVHQRWLWGVGIAIGVVAIGFLAVGVFGITT